MKNIKFIAFGSNSMIGGFGPGDTMTNVDPKLAAYLVDEVKVAEYAPEQAPAAPAEGKTTIRAPRVRKGAGS
jgi:hypothetical protein